MRLQQDPIHTDGMFIGGKWVAPSGSDRITVTSASTEDTIGSVPQAREADVDAAVAAAKAAFDDPAGWRTWQPSQRADAIDSLADQLQARSEEMAQRVSAQNGMPIVMAQQVEVGFSLSVIRYFAELARTTELELSHPHLLGGITTVRREPIGVVAAIAPWNFPQALTASKYAPALAAGATVVLKPSPETVLDAALFCEAVAASDIPAGVLSVVPGGRDIGAYLVCHPDVDRVAFTGSTAAGREIAQKCGQLLRPVTLELGGKSAAIIVDDAALDLATVGESLFSATLLNNGQTCFASTRVLAPRSRYDEVVGLLEAVADSLTVGDALDPSTQIGPMATARHRDRVESYIAKGRDGGARLVTGGSRPPDQPRGWFVQPTVFADVDNSQVVAQEEIFGPVLAVIPYTDDADAVRIANDSAYGLGGTVWTSDPERGRAIANGVHTGTIGINGYLPDPSSPFGGVKDSGIGRELGPDAIASFQQCKSIYS